MFELDSLKRGKVLGECTGIYFVGDKKTDVQTGINAGGKGILIRREKNGKDLTEVMEMQRDLVGRVIVVNDFLHAATVILSDVGKS